MNNANSLSQVLYSVKVVEYVQIPMKDGTFLSAHLAKPDVDGKFPVIFVYTPYHKDSYLWYAWHFFVERGYIVIHVDIRGTGESEGYTNTFGDPKQILDGIEVIEWIACQEWCNGNIGMTGLSYDGFVCWQVAMYNPKPLKAIIIYQCMTDFYTEYFAPGGSIRPFVFEQTAPLMTALNAMPPNPEIVGEKWSEMWKERLNCCIPWGIAMISNLQDGPYWRERSLSPSYDRIKCATFLISGWGDWYPDDFLRTFTALKCPKKIIIGPWSHDFPSLAFPFPRIDDRNESLKWFDLWLKDCNTEVMEEPPITIFIKKFNKPDIIRIRDNGFFRSENEWPLKRENLKPFYLGDKNMLFNELDPDLDGTVTIEYDPSVGIAAGRYVIGQIPPSWGMPLDQRLDEPHSLVFTSEYLKKDIEVTGIPKVVLFISSTADIAYFSVKLCDVAPDGTSALVSKAGLNVMHRESHINPSPIIPGHIYELGFDLQAMAYLFQVGHRIRVMVSCSDFQNAWPTPKNAINTIYISKKYPSQVILPIIQQQNPILPSPNIVILDELLPKIEEIYKPEYNITYNLINETTQISYRNEAFAGTADNAGINESNFTVSHKNPAHAFLESSYECYKEYLGINFLIKASCSTVSDENSFHHLVILKIDVNDCPYFQKSWTVSIKRKGC